MTSTTVKPSAAADKKDVQKLQRAIIDGLEDVKAQDIQVFDTEHITSLFERVIIASGSSNRQTKALAASVRDAVRDAGFAKPRIEGEENGEWIIVDCGAAVAHIMQPTIRQYYHLEELWGDKPIKLKLGAPAPLVKAAKPEAQIEAKPAAKPKAPRSGAKSATKPTAKTPSKTPAKAPTAPDSSYVGRVGKTNDWTAKRNAAEPAAEPATRSAKTAAKGAPARSAAKPAVKTPIIKVPVAKKVAAKKTAAKTAAKTAGRKPAAKKTPSRSK
ncbi:MAG: ribosome silencing factor [Polaromonas sp.]|uniref:ribosome silencing factor n=1 Tax=Polaromonas sp. TaxID=1869339 RepID=UPI0032647791